jgi:hypothetical protein
MPLPENARFPRDRETLLRELDAAIKIRDIERVQRWRDRVELKWYEAGIVLLLFISGLGFVITIFKLIPHNNAQLFWFVFFWFLLFTITLVAAVEFLLAKIHALRQLYNLNTLMLERVEKQLSHFLQQQSTQQHEADDQ